MPGIGRASPRALLLALIEPAVAACWLAPLDAEVEVGLQARRGRAGLSMPRHTGKRGPGPGRSLAASTPDPGYPGRRNLGVQGAESGVRARKLRAVSCPR